MFLFVRMTQPCNGHVCWARGIKLRFQKNAMKTEKRPRGRHCTTCERRASEHRTSWQEGDPSLSFSLILGGEGFADDRALPPWSSFPAWHARHSTHRLSERSRITRSALRADAKIARGISASRVNRCDREFKRRLVSPPARW